MTTDIASSGLDVMRGDFEENERAMRALSDRVLAIEEDPRAADALEATKDIAELSEDVGRLQKELDEGLAELNARVEQVADTVRIFLCLNLCIIICVMPCEPHLGCVEGSRAALLVNAVETMKHGTLNDNAV